MSNVTYKYIRRNNEIQAYINHADAALLSIGYTEHSNAHVEKAAKTAFDILSCLGYDERDCELAQIAAYMHDIGNVVNRSDHAQTGGLMAFRLLEKMDMPADEIAVIISAIGNHDEKTAMPVNPVAAALILADKMDVRRSRVRNSHIEDPSGFATDVHDRVNYACVESKYYFSEDKSELFLDLIIDLKISSIIDYFEIFLERMLLCRRAAKTLNVEFRLVINNYKVM
ncbi:MAG: HD domain-containing protein [Eubacterium sp.]|nr:HD domain-containing protein [Eubacterium sp.]